MLANAKPRCQLRRIKVDLTDADARVAALQDAVTPSTQALVITEGLLVYLDDAQVSDLSRDLAALAGVRYWILDLGSPAILAMMRKGMGAHLTNAPLKFAPANGIAFFEVLGWGVAQVHSYFPRGRAISAFAMVSETIRTAPGAQSQETRQGALVRRRAAYAGRLTSNRQCPRAAHSYR